MQVQYTLWSTPNVKEAYRNQMEEAVDAAWPILSRKILKAYDGMLGERLRLAKTAQRQAVPIIYRSRFLFSSLVGRLPSDESIDGIQKDGKRIAEKMAGLVEELKKIKSSARDLFYEREEELRYILMEPSLVASMASYRKTNLLDSAHPLHADVLRPYFPENAKLVQELVKSVAQDVKLRDKAKKVMSEAERITKKNEGIVNSKHDFRIIKKSMRIDSHLDDLTDTTNDLSLTLCDSSELVQYVMKKYGWDPNVEYWMKTAGKQSTYVNGRKNSYHTVEEKDGKKYASATLESFDAELGEMTREFLRKRSAIRVGLAQAERSVLNSLEVPLDMFRAAAYLPAFLQTMKNSGASNGDLLGQIEGELNHSGLFKHVKLSRGVSYVAPILESKVKTWLELSHEDDKLQPVARRIEPGISRRKSNGVNGSNGTNGSKNNGSNGNGHVTIHAKKSEKRKEAPLTVA